MFTGPLLAVGLLHVWMLPRVLGRQSHRATTLRQWLLFGLIISATVASSIGGFIVYLAVEQTLNWSQVLQVSALPTAIVVSAAILNAVGYWWLRMLGYELRTG